MQLLLVAGSWERENLQQGSPDLQHFTPRLLQLQVPALVSGPFRCEHRMLKVCSRTRVRRVPDRAWRAQSERSHGLETFRWCNFRAHLWPLNFPECFVFRPRSPKTTEQAWTYRSCFSQHTGEGWEAASWPLPHCGDCLWSVCLHLKSVFSFVFLGAEGRRVPSNQTFTWK